MIDVPPLAAPAETEKIRHSRLGIASFVISIGVGFAFLMLFVVAGILAHREAGREYAGQSLVGAIAILLFAGDVVAAGLGIAGVCQPRVKKVFAILGTVFSLFTIIGSVALIIIGLIYGAR